MPFLDDAVAFLVSFTARWILVLVSLMAGSVIMIGPGWVKLRVGSKFLGVRRLFAYMMVETLALTVFWMFLLDPFEGFLMKNLVFLPAIANVVLGTFVLWLVHIADWDFKEGRKWVWPVVCYSIAIANIVMKLMLDPPSAASP